MTRPKRTSALGSVSLLVFPVVVVGALVSGEPGLPVPPDPGRGFDGDRAARWAHQLLQTAPHRGPDDAGRARAASWIAARLREAGVEDVRVEKFVARRRTWHNVAGRLRGASAGRPILIGAHLDAVTGSPGALDDAAGVAAVLEVSRILANDDLSRTVEIRIFDGEEQGLLGSRREVRAGRARPSVALLLDVVGRRGGRLVIHSLPLTWMEPAPAPVPVWLAATTIGAGQRAGVALSYGDDLLSYAYQFVVRTCRVPFASDDGPFLARRIPALFLSDFSFSRPYVHYHRPTDDAAQIDAAALGRVGRTLLATVRTLQAAQVLPGWDASPYLFVGLVAVTGPWLFAGLLSALVPLLGGLFSGGPHLRSLLLVVGLAGAWAAAPVAATCVFLIPAWALGGVAHLAWRRGRWLALASLLPGIYCLMVMTWAFTIHGTAMRVLAPPGFLVGGLVFSAVWLEFMAKARRH